MPPIFLLEVHLLIQTGNLAANNDYQQLYANDPAKFYL